ncbi:hypothetical protein M409DRAFT_69823 [Zasmidium cellare ATCC 36951]|uniref:Transglycosylase SLT domain-containing protein n=1 Tax=Zasmidium cellare ATCC 36951 TaxID=1080233 RepID=A0A6A6C3J8_ZASCE|nr:uncharacterized protein M409DRAFT_69823 [Zasmidium cellare ATCC 36951]KAF2161493.1 hypothetical protein M409DRAFT_69823 [Zasmidium cellare ATCC 36951]
MTGDVSYEAYKGDGSVSAGWPDQTDWIDFRNMWFINQNTLINKLCDNTPAETTNLYKAILQVSTSTSVDPRFILAVIMEESHGCVRVQSTSLSVTNPGLMQSYQGKGSCASPTLLNPCPWSEIVQMINDGTAPNAAGVDLKDLLGESNKTDVSMYYIASRMYNSGKLSVGADGELSVGGANACYAADIANRLRGYVGGSCGDSTG